MGKLKNRQAVDTKSEVKKDVTVDSFSKFICTSNKPLYIIGLTVTFSILLFGEQFLTDYRYMIYIGSMIAFVVTMCLAYFIGKKLKTKKDKLEIKKITVGKKALFIVLSIIYILIITIIIAFIVTSIQLSQYDTNYLLMAQ